MEENLSIVKDRCELAIHIDKARSLTRLLFYLKRDDIARGCYI